jgi:hypothetical protein
MTTIVETVSKMLDEVENEISHEKDYILNNPKEFTKFTELEKQFIKELVDYMYSRRFEDLSEGISRIRKSFEKDVESIAWDMMLYFKHKARALDSSTHYIYYMTVLRFDPEALNKIDMDDYDPDDRSMYEEMAEKKEGIFCGVEEKEEYKDIGDDIKHYAYKVYRKYVNMIRRLMSDNYGILSGIVYKKR